MVHVGGGEGSGKTLRVQDGYQERGVVDRNRKLRVADTYGVLSRLVWRMLKLS